MRLLEWFYRVFFTGLGSIALLGALLGFVNMKSLFSGRSGPMDFMGAVIVGVMLLIGVSFLYCGLSFRKLLEKRTWVLFLVPTCYFLLLLWLSVDTGAWGPSLLALAMEVLFLGGIYYLKRNADSAHL